MMRPFRLAQSSWRGELNPLLQTDLMVFHPPLVFLFYSLCIVVMLKALASVLSDEKVDESQLREMVTPPARVALVVGTFGVGLGGRWAYTVLDWGGYWAWDPVETASLLPWLSLLLLLHLRVTPG
jgi:cytochrome c-type biogenesis protein CcmF